MTDLSQLPDPPCSNCHGSCCQRLDSEPYAVMLADEEIALFPEAVMSYGCFEAGEIVIPYNDQGRCIFLTSDNKCGIYDRRPLACRSFNCLRDYISSDGWHGPFFDLRKDVARIIEAERPEFVKNRGGPLVQAD